MRRRAEGLPRNEAVALACQDRLRPILMTSLITIITMLPVALAPKTGMDAYQPLGTVIVSGLLVGTLLSLLVIPVMHVAVDDVTQWLSKHRRRVGTALILLLALSLPEAKRTAAAADAISPPVISARLSLADAIGFALADNPSLKEAEADKDAASAGGAICASAGTAKLVHDDLWHGRRFKQYLHDFARCRAAELVQCPSARFRRPEFNADGAALHRRTTRRPHAGRPKSICPLRTPLWPRAACQSRKPSPRLISSRCFANL